MDYGRTPVLARLHICAPLEVEWMGSENPVKIFY
jgi:hypothetical protein